MSASGRRYARRAPQLSVLLTALQLGAFVMTALTTVLAIIDYATFVPGTVALTSQASLGVDCRARF
eukprot:6877571-Pyramimonas_sp.AAC.1